MDGAGCDNAQKSWRRNKSLNLKLEKRVEERTHKLNEAVKDLESFAYSVSHDLRRFKHIDGFVRLMFSKINKPEDIIMITITG